MKIVKILSVAMLVIASAAFAADEHDQALIERIKPVGEHCKAGANCANGAIAAEAGATSAAAASAGGASAGRSGADIVAKHCAMCHGTPGIPGAPNSHETWAPRVEAKGIDGLVASATSGIGAMPPKGMCMDCSEEELKAAIEEMSK